MKKYGFLLSGQWIGMLVLTVLASLLCLYLADWQLGRKHELDFSNSRISENYYSDAVLLADEPDVFAVPHAELRWKPVQMRGEYVVDQQVLVRNRPYKGLNGYEVLVPFKTVEGPVVLVNRGWLEAAFGDASAPAREVPAPPSGEVTVVARLVEGEIDTGKGATAGQVSSIYLPAIAQMTGLELDTAAYGVMASEEPAVATPVLKDPPEEDYGPNLSYSVQWYSFALMFYVAYVWSARQKVRNDELDAQVAAELDAYFGQFYDADGTYIGDEDEELVRRRMEFVDDMPAHMRSVVRPKPVKKRSKPSDEDEEDAIVDALRARL